jgi:hypothetical protein
VLVFTAVISRVLQLVTIIGLKDNHSEGQCLTPFGLDTDVSWLRRGEGRLGGCPLKSLIPQSRDRSLHTLSG